MPKVSQQLRYWGYTETQNRIVLLAYHMNIESDQYTKLKVLSTITSLIDPIGTLGPTLLWSKSFMQELWQSGVDGDTPLPDKFYGTRNEFVKVLPSLNKIIVSHHIDIWSLTAIQLIGFADASKSG